MPLWKRTDRCLTQVEPRTFESVGMWERRDLQPLLRRSPQAIELGLTIVSEEYGGWEDSKRRIDLLALDGNLRLTVIELKRTEEGGHLELQALRYAAMVANLTADDLCRAREDCRAKLRGQTGEELPTLRGDLSLSEDEPFEISSEYPRVVLISRDFSKEITTAVMWLNTISPEKLDIRCLRAVPYEIEGQLYFDMEQVIPLPQSNDYMVQKVKREQEAEAVREARRTRTFDRLVKAGIFTTGTHIVLLQPELKDMLATDPRVRASLSSTNIEQRTVTWEFDGASYSLSGLTGKLRDELGFPFPRSLNGYLYWRIDDEDGRSLWDRAGAIAEIRS